MATEFLMNDETDAELMGGSFERKSFNCSEFLLKWYRLFPLLARSEEEIESSTAKGISSTRKYLFLNLTILFKPGRPEDEEEWNSLKLAFNPLLALRIDQKFELENELKNDYLRARESAWKEVSLFFATSKSHVFSVKFWRTKFNNCKINYEESESFFEIGSLTLASICLKALDLSVKNFLSDLKLKVLSQPWFFIKSF